MKINLDLDADPPEPAETISLTALAQFLRPSNLSDVKTSSLFTGLDPSIKRFYRSRLSSWAARETEERACAALLRGDMELFQSLRREYYRITGYWF